MAEMMKSACLKLIAKLDERDQDAVLARLDELQAQGIPAKDAQVQAVADVILNLKREAFGDPGQDVPDADDGSIKKSQAREFARITDFDGMTLRRPSADIKVSAASAFADEPFTIQPGVRDVPLSEVQLQDTPFLRSEQEQARIRRLADAIKTNRSIEPLFIAQRIDGSRYVAEGQHRAYALKMLGYDSVPARVMVESPRDIKKSQTRDITETPEFKRWFGNSKVVDADGKPLVVYHGTSSNFSTFKPSKQGTYGKGIYFANTRESAEQFGAWDGREQKVIDAYISLQNPWTPKAEFDSEAAFAEDVDSPIVEAVLALPGGRKILDDAKASGTMDYGHFGEGLQRTLKKLGYDGIIANYGDGSMEVIAFDSKQVKSASANSGEFGNTGNIYKSTERNAMGFYSALAKGIDSMPTKAAPAGAWKAQIKGLVNKGAVKQDEITWSGLEDFLDLQTGKITKEQIADYLKQGGVKVEETVLGDNPVFDVQRKYESAMQKQGATPAKSERMFNAMLAFARDEEHNEEQKDLGFSMVMDAGFTGNEIHDAVNGYDKTKYSQYTLPGGENYMEVLLTLPEQRPLTKLWRHAQEAFGDDDPRTIAAKKAAKPEAKGDRAYRSSHWDQKNVIAHIRVNDRVDADGAKTLFVEEIQSDHQQDYRKARDAIKRAVESDFQSIVNRLKKAGVLEVECD